MATILHVDMDAFFASVELLHHPEWRGRPLVVGAGPHERGVVSTCSYEARKFGVRSAMPSRTAYELCPHAIFVRPDMERYSEVSGKAFEVFESFTPFVEGVSIDEAFLDITGSSHLYGGARALGDALRKAVKDKCGVTCSVGIAPNRLLAKIGSELDKPDGLSVMPFEADEIAKFLENKPVSILWGIGKKTVQTLKPFGITVCGDIQKTPVGTLAAILGSQCLAGVLRNYSFGIDSDEVHWQEAEEKSVSREHTFGADVYDRETVRAKLLELAAEVGMRLRRRKRWAKTAKLKLRDANFNTLTRQLSLASPTRDDISLREAALELFSRETTARGIRLVGFGVGSLRNDDDDGTPTLFDYPDDTKRKRRERLSEALDDLRAKGLID